MPAHDVFDTGRVVLTSVHILSRACFIVSKSLKFEHTRLKYMIRLTRHARHICVFMC
jgi:hypothetical protein